ncbi:MAG: hypothetical protein A2Y45_00390 [Tenericutes bacterium GWC2_34_14]|nr:MAG: hypothetical protein A2Z84_02600 [Tenericutes bacterium GWA2_35_7]OHE29361.1 MAG: hypothetical protein A2Y45_00390 [Tenericutes bacterium GWC2_34_14]OHE34458.1 MAG: hypothetical protein A2012_08010 [Tenericutes bacterium GWE2_34_108]OHE35814.1 MAG: hypothetical protein A2Y46_02715 [Tenericutes bacterium GWF1_35_14]OHE39099.1 MAG: hypothetical protein A2Y44_07215 [Tenericutes bacterium GWF2_35_184]OHE42834.1 MAG: hypothetical protein A2221_09020 [Tenericutes bacterium RIFOXYA2_FULL_36_3
MLFTLDRDLDAKLNDLTLSIFTYLKSNDISFNDIVKKINRCYIEYSDEEKEYRKGFFDAMMMLVKSKNDLIKKNSHFDSCFEKSKYTYIITLTLKKKDHINHTELANQLEMKKNQLSNITKIIVAHGLITDEKIGREKFYYITEYGKQFYDYITKNKNVEHIVKPKRQVTEKTAIFESRL